jgi:hypothetical protein
MLVFEHRNSLIGSANTIGASDKKRILRIEPFEQRQHDFSPARVWQHGIVIEEEYPIVRSCTLHIIVIGSSEIAIIARRRIRNADEESSRQVPGTVWVTATDFRIR